MSARPQTLRAMQGIRKSHQNSVGHPVVYLLSVILVLICIVPVIYIIIGGFRTNSQITRYPAGLPKPWNFENYKNVFASNIFWTELVNSLIVGVAYHGGNCSTQSYG